MPPVLPEVSAADAERAAGEHGTPCYLYSLGRLRSRWQVLESSLISQGFAVRYALKANPHPRILAELLRLGAGLDASSPRDLSLARESGCPAERVVFSRGHLAAGDLEALRKYPATPVVSDPRDLAALRQAGPGLPRCLLRMARPAGLSLYHLAGSEEVPPKAGFSEGQMQEVLAEPWAAEMVRGLHFHAGTEISGPSFYLEMMERLFPLFEARSFLDTLDIGGGLAVAFVDEEEDLDPAPIGRGLAEMAERLGRRLQGLVEPGMYLMGPAGAVLTRVLRVREPHPGTDAVRLLLDASVNQWPGGTFWNAINPVRPLVDRPGPPRRTWLFGQTSMDVDRFGPPRLLPPLEEGDLLLIGNCGAYAAVRQTSFNELDPAAEVVLP